MKRCRKGGAKRVRRKGCDAIEACKKDVKGNGKGVRKSRKFVMGYIQCMNGIGQILGDFYKFVVL